MPENTGVRFGPVDEGYCDLCEVEGHAFRTCPRRDDSEDRDCVDPDRPVLDPDEGWDRQDS